VLRRQRDVFGDARFARLGSISVAHLYNLRASERYRAQRGCAPAGRNGGSKGPTTRARCGSWGRS
jgi:hypothetical protein